jgi:probable aminopeptidase NPEPL1
MYTSLSFVSASVALAKAESLVVVGRMAALSSEPLQAQLPGDLRGVLAQILEELKPGDDGKAASSWTGGDSPSRLIVCLLPEHCSRHNTPTRSYSIAALLRKQLPSSGAVAVLLALDEPGHALAAASAVARCLPLYSRKTNDDGGDDQRSVSVALVGPEGPLAPDSRSAAVSEAVRFAGRLVDTPTSTLNTDAFVEEARAVAASVGAEIEVIRGEQLEERGFGGLWGVGRAAVHPPALVILSCGPEDAERTVAWVGKGIVYDTGGLSIKSKTGMPGMKADMGGAAAVLGAFQVAASGACGDRLYALLCLAENSVGPEATRPDDILSMYSGKTVEVNNTDAEGRLVLADGVAYAARHLSPDVIVDLATLTGAQGVSTGQRHAGIVCNDDALEARAIAAGKSSGDLVHPLPYCPEFFRKEFQSEVADLKNSVKNRSNAQASCAAQFVGEHLGDYEGGWLHVDLAGPSTWDERGTGFGVGLLVELFGLGGA